MKTQLKLCLMVIILILVGCSTKCPGFPDKYADYLPYSKGQELRFTNTNNDTIVFETTEFYQTTEHEISSCGKCECEPVAILFVFYADSLSSNNLYFENIKGEIHFRDSQILNCFINISYKYDTFESNNDDLNTQISTKNLSDTIIINKTDPTRISNLTIVKGKGIISFYDISNQSDWVLIEKN